jgi:hypothetical protein
MTDVEFRLQHIRDSASGHKVKMRGLWRPGGARSGTAAKITAEQVIAVETQSMAVPDMSVLVSDVGMVGGSVDCESSAPLP